MFIIQKIKEIRISKNLTQAELSELSHVSQANISQYEKGKFQPTFDKLVKIAQALDVPIETFFDKDLRKSLSSSKQADFKDDQLPLIVLKKDINKDTTTLEFSKTGKPKGQDTVYISKPFHITDPNAYVVKLGDNSMSPGIEKGWMVLVSPEAEVHEGDYVLVKLESNEVTLRVLNIQDDSMAILKPTNFNHRSVAVLLDQVKFMHKVVNIMPS